MNDELNVTARCPQCLERLSCAVCGTTILTGRNDVERLRAENDALRAGVTALLEECASLRSIGDWYPTIEKLQAIIDAAALTEAKATK